MGSIETYSVFSSIHASDPRGGRCAAPAAGSERKRTRQDYLVVQRQAKPCRKGGEMLETDLINEKVISIDVSLKVNAKHGFTVVLYKPQAADFRGQEVGIYRDNVLILIGKIGRAHV